MFNNKHFYDLSNFKKEQNLNKHSKSTAIFHSDENRKVIGKFKDEFAGEPNIEFVGLRSNYIHYLMKCAQLIFSLSICV